MWNLLCKLESITVQAIYMSTTNYIKIQSYIKKFKAESGSLFKPIFFVMKMALVKAIVNSKVV